MKKTLCPMAILAALLLSFAPGCGSDGAVSNVAEDADAQAMADYEAAMEAESAAMSENATQ